MLRDRLASLPLFRPLVLRVLRVTSRDITIKNPWSEDALLLNSYRHKDYWYHGKKRELETMQMFRQIIPRGGTVLEVGGHIGFITQFFSSLVGDEGVVVVFEPGSNNLPYIRKNASKPNIRLEELAISNAEGMLPFYEENLTGLNNSLSADYWGAEATAKTHYISPQRNTRIVEVTTIDSYVQRNVIEPDFIKIDIEGNELNALRGATGTLSKLPALMVEVTEDYRAVAEILRKQGFKLFNPQGEELREINFLGNVFALRN